MDKKERKIFDKLPFEIVETEAKTSKSIRNRVQVGPKKYVLPIGYKDYGLDIYNFEARPDDVYLIGYPRSGLGSGGASVFGLNSPLYLALCVADYSPRNPVSLRNASNFLKRFVMFVGSDTNETKVFVPVAAGEISGTTLHREMVWLIANDLNYEEAAKEIMLQRFPHIDVFVLPTTRIKEALGENEVNDNIKETAEKIAEISLREISERKGRRFIGSHLPISLMPPHIFEVGAKVIYCARNPKDALASFYGCRQFFKTFKEGTTFEEYFNEYKSNQALFDPYFEHVKEAWARRNDENFLFIFYEDTIKDKKQTMLKIAEFLGKTLSNDQLQSLEDYLNIDKFRNNKSVNFDFLTQLGVADKNMSFMGKGKPGGWKEYFVGDLKNEVDEWMEENLKGTDLKFPEV